MYLKNIFIALLLLLAGCGPSAETSKCDLVNLTEELPAGISEQSIARSSNLAAFGKDNDGKPGLSDVTQAPLNICYFYAFLSSYVAAKPEDIKKSIRRIPGGYEVDVYDQNYSCVSVSDRQLGILREKAHMSTKVLWPEILAAVWVAYVGEQELSKIVDNEIKKTGIDRERGVTSMREGSTIPMTWVMKDPFQYFLNKPGKVRRIKPKIGDAKSPAFFKDEKDLLSFVDSCKKQDCVMYAYVAPGGETPGARTPTGLPNGLYDHHCYGVIDVDAVNELVNLRNPHGSNARAVAYDSQGAMVPSRQINEKFSLRSDDFYRQFYTLQFSDF